MEKTSYIEMTGDDVAKLTMKTIESSYHKREDLIRTFIEKRNTRYDEQNARYENMSFLQRWWANFCSERVQKISLTTEQILLWVIGKENFYISGELDWRLRLINRKVERCDSLLAATKHSKRVFLSIEDFELIS